MHCLRRTQILFCLIILTLFTNCAKKENPQRSNNSDPQKKSEQNLTEDVYVPVVSGGTTEVAFFETKPQMLTSGEMRTFATRWNPKRTVQFAISSNTPADFKEAVRDGILYWNQVFGKSFIEVVDAPEGASAPDMNYNIVQWRDVSSTYADMQIDPKTGEIKHAQVLFSSNIAVRSKAELKLLLEKQSLQKKSSLVKKVSAPGFDQDLTCDLTVNAAMQAELRELLKQDVSDDIIKKVSQDYVRAIVAHEIGHTLGLRHNFAGSLVNNYLVDEREIIFQNYLSSGITPDNIVPTSSVMEYMALYEAAMAGALIAQKAAPFSYDKKAIDVLYHEKNLSEYTDSLLFCTDSHVMKNEMLDCVTGDYGASLINFAANSSKKYFSLLPTQLLEDYKYAKANSSNTTLTVDSVSIYIEQTARLLLNTKALILKAASNQAKLLKIRRQYTSVNPLNLAEVEKRERDLLQSQIESTGSLDVLMQLPTQAEFNQLQTEFITKLNDAQEFTPEEKQNIQTQSKKYFVVLKQELEKQHINQLAEISGKVADHPIAQLFANYYYNEANKILFTKHKNETVTAQTVEGETIQIQLPIYKEDFQTRQKAAKLLDQDRGENKTWCFEQRRQLQQDIEEEIKEVLKNHTTEDFNINTTPEKLTMWLLETENIQKILN